MVKIKFNCPHCNESIETGEETAGMQARCPTCSNDIIIPVLKKGEVTKKNEVPNKLTQLATAKEIDSPPPPPPSSPRSDEQTKNRTKSCPFCGEVILVVAKKCKHCGEFLDPNLAQAKQSSPIVQEVKIAKSPKSRQAYQLLAFFSLDWSVFIIFMPEDIYKAQCS